jgi:hypothetical protein
LKDNSLVEILHITTKEFRHVAGTFLKARQMLASIEPLVRDSTAR